MLKDSARRATLIHLLSYISDRYITRDRIHYGTSEYFRTLIHGVFGPASIEREFRVPPWRNYIAFLVRASE